MGINRQIPHLGNTGQGINRKRPHLSDAGVGINRQIPHDNGGSCAEWSAHLQSMMRALADRLRRVRVCCGDWQRIIGATPTENLGMTGVFLDPPYSFEAGRDMGLYAEDSGDVAHDVRRWAIANGDNPLLRIALCGYGSEHDMPASWERFAWKAHGGYSNLGNGAGKANKLREMVWFSPACLRTGVQVDMFAEREEA